ncbi:DNA polymerase Y family protein [Gryllotalpicola sp.]|uniref:DNA polymerase Y family protein n=1 Tax=Gryllotalpicola sp. TaxID=1932787 RepID=UPI00260F037F|nr:DNA polymerase Y family protein [Gryllotalpicola sp.]
MNELTRSMVLWCPDWPVRAHALQHPELDGDAPLALIDKGEVFACSAAARAAGVARGLRVREAQARCPALAVVAYDAALDARLFEPVLAAIEQLVPGVQPIRPGLFALRTRGPARYYGGEQPLAATLIAALGSVGVPDARAGAADGPFAAQLAVQATSAESAVLLVPPGSTSEFLAGQSVEAVGDVGFAELCRRLGLSTLGSLAGFGEDELATRFGALGLRVHALVTGRDAETVVSRPAAAQLERSIAFDDGVDRVDQLAFAIRATADEVVAALIAAHLVCTAVTVTMETEGETSVRTWLHPRWFTAADLVDRVRWQLHGVGGALGLSSPVLRVTLTPESVDSVHHHEEGLWGDAPDERVHHALSRVQSMLGHEGVVTARVGGGRLLDEREVLVPWGDPVPAEIAGAAKGPWPGALPDPLPATVFRQRLAVSVADSSGEPVLMDGSGALTGDPAVLVVGAITAVVIAWAGPWPVIERWWDAAAARGVQRLSLIDEVGTAWLLVFEGGAWAAEARYD